MSTVPGSGPTPATSRSTAPRWSAATRGGATDNLWILVADVAAAKRLDETIAPDAGLRLRVDTADRVQFKVRVCGY